jgi:hypothetical protein
VVDAVLLEGRSAREVAGQMDLKRCPPFAITAADESFL